MPLPTKEFPCRETVTTKVPKQAYELMKDFSDRTGWSISKVARYLIYRSILELEGKREELKAR
jgi:hypothetical protein